MFDIGFFELVIIGVIALLVLGPERMPHAVRMTGAWLGKFRRATMSIRDEIEREVNAYEIQERLKEQIENSGVNDAKEMLEETKQSLKGGILDDETLKAIEEQGLSEYAKSLTDAAKEKEEKHAKVRHIASKPKAETTEANDSEAPTPSDSTKPAQP